MPRRGQHNAPMKSVSSTDLTAAEHLQKTMQLWRPDHTGTLLFLVVGGRVLLIHKKTGHGAGKINAPGGKLEADETPLLCAVRETREEVGIDVEKPRLAARLRFADTDAPGWLGYVFLSHGYSGVPRSTAEAVPQWFSLKNVPYHRMWEADRIWLPRVLTGAWVEGDFLFEGGALRAYRLSGHKAH